MSEAAGPLEGLRVIELASMGPGPFCAMLLADLGADVIRVDRAHGASLPGPNFDFRVELLNRGRSSIAVDLKHAEGRDVVLDLVERADVLVEGYRAGVTERLGVGPDECLARNPRLVYGRMTGYGQDGPLAHTAGHDINYVAQSGILSLIGRRGEAPTPPLSLAGDFGGGGMVLALGIVSAVLEARTSGVGQVVDASMTDGAALLGVAFYGFRQTGSWSDERGTNLVDSGAPFYDAYETADGKYLAVGAIEPHFYAELLKLLELDPVELPDQDDKARWPELKKVIADRIRTRAREEWLADGEGRSACISAVLSTDEAPRDPHNVARGTFVDVEGILQPAPAPKFSRTPTAVRRPPPLPGEHTLEKLSDWGVSDGQVRAWQQSGAIRQHTHEEPVARGLALQTPDKEHRMKTLDKTFETLVLDERSPGVVVVTLNRPDRYNAMTNTMFDEMERVALDLGQEDDLRVVILTGAGKAFCSGYDLADADELPHLGALGMLNQQERAARSLLAIRSIRVPVIGAIHGAAAGGGFSLTLACDIRIASTDVKFNAAFVKIGLTAGDLGVSWLLTRLIGPAHASDICFTGRFVYAEEALKLGLVNKVSEPGALLDDAVELALAIVANSPGGVQLSKRALQANMEVSSYAAALELENRGQALMTRTADMSEALAAFKERRAPVFTGK